MMAANIMASKEEVVYDLLGIAVSEYSEINVYFDNEIIHLQKNGNYLYEHCSIRFKTALGLKRHSNSMKSCSQKNFEFLSAEMLSTLASEVKANAMSDDCLIDSFKDAVSEISSKLMVNKLATDLEPLTETFMKNHKSEMFWEFYFGFIMDYNTYFSKVDDQICASYVLMNLGEKF